MTTTLRPPSLEAPSTPGDAAADSSVGPFGRIVIGSVATGLVAAAGLTLVVYAGAEEHVITGTGLLAFAFGWLLLAVGSVRYTNRPQRWAYVPAAAMAAVGLALVLFAPDNDALTAIGWVWPPLLFVLSSWIGRMIHRNVPGRSRWALYPVALVLTVASVGGGFETVAIERDHDRLEMPGQAYDIGGRSLHLNCVGSGAPTVVFSNGLGETSALWERFMTAPQLIDTRRCAYDRAGQGWSDDAPEPADSVDVAADLHALLAAAGEAGPFVLVGHSAGGPYAMTFAARHPDDVAGLVLLDASSPRQFEAIPSFPGVYAMARSTYGVIQTISRTGLLRAAPASFYSSLPDDAGDAVRAFASSPRNLRTARDEHSQYRKAFPQALALTSFGDKPLVVVTATEGMSGGWVEAQEELAALSSNSRQDLVATDHVGVVDDVSALGTSVAAVADAVDAVRTLGRVR